MGIMGKPREKLPNPKSFTISTGNDRVLRLNAQCRRDILLNLSCKSVTRDSHLAPQHENRIKIRIVNRRTKRHCVVTFKHGILKRGRIHSDRASSGPEKISTVY